jgi:hypothetical protein
MTHYQDRDISTEMTIYSTTSEKLVHVDRSNRISARELHKYTVGLIGIFMLFVITYPIAIYRVAQQAKLGSDRSHLKSLTVDYKSIDFK